MRRSHPGKIRELFAFGADGDLRRPVAAAADTDLPGTTAHGAVLDERFILFAGRDGDRARLAAIGTNHLDVVLHGERLG